MCSLAGLSISITPGSGNNTAGEIYSLVCSVTVIGSTDQPTIIWQHSNVEAPFNSYIRVSATTMSSDGNYTSILTFDPLAASHAGVYRCNAMAGGAIRSNNITISVNSECISGRSKPKLIVC